MAADPNKQHSPAAANICIADTDRDFLAQVAEMIASEGVQIRRSASAAELLAAIDAGTVCVISDVGLPDQGGIEMLATLRSRGLKTPVILMGSDADVATAVAAMRAGALDFVEKPHGSRLLAWHVRRLLEGQGQEGN